MTAIVGFPSSILFGAEAGAARLNEIDPYLWRTERYGNAGAVTCGRSIGGSAGRFLAYAELSLSRCFVVQRDRLTGNTETVVSLVVDGGTVVNGGGTEPSVSADGRYVAFTSSGTNQIGTGADTNNVADVFVRDLAAEITTRVSVSGSGEQANGSSASASLSSDGRYVLFQSSATNLIGVGNDTNGATDIFLHDRQTGATSRVSVSSVGAQANDDSFSPRLSSDGRYAVFSSDASNLVPSDGNGASDVFVRDLQLAQTSRISVADLGVEANESSFAAAIASGGRYVVFSSDASNLVAGDTNDETDVFRHDRTTGLTIRVSVGTDGQESGLFGSSSEPSVSDDGRFVAFQSTSEVFSLGDQFGTPDVFIRDVTAGRTTRIMSPTGPLGFASNPSLSGDGRTLAYTAIVGGSNYMLHVRSPRPAVTSITPSTGNAVGGTSVSIGGSGFYVGDGLDLEIGGASMTSAIMVSETSMTGSTPSRPDGAGAVAVTVVGPGFESTLPAAFSYTTSPPTFGDITPGSARRRWMQRDSDWQWLHQRRDLARDRRNQRNERRRQQSDVAHGDDSRWPRGHARRIGGHGRRYRNRIWPLHLFAGVPARGEPVRHGNRHGDEHACGHQLRS